VFRDAELTTTGKDEYAFCKDGFEIRRAVLGADEMDAIRAEVSLDNATLRRTGIRNLEKKFDSIARVAQQTSVVSIAESALGRAPQLVRALFFDKTPERNWFVTWHQDRTVTLNRHIDLAGWGSWTFKDGVHHVQPPRAVLDRMVTIRLHIDPANLSTGCLRVIPGSHRYGILRAQDIGPIVVKSAALACVADPGDAVVMHPLILHSSAKSKSDAHRRIVHLEFSSYDLPPGIAWA
jgi:ectoine hydroxylase-related dioxygenase (phytanoyl-CoA dioxygenase family)